MHIIGLGTTAQVGKDTTAAYLEERYPLDGPGPFFVKRVAFADKLKEITMSLFELSYEQCYGDKDVKEAVDPRYGKSPRQILQEVGERMRSIINPHIWVDTVFSNVIPELAAQGYNTFVISDVRYPNEADKVHAAGGGVVKITRPGSGTSVGASHASETSMNSYEGFDFHIDNDGSLNYLYSQADALMEVINDRETGWDVD